MTTHRSRIGGGDWHDERVPTLADSPTVRNLAATTLAGRCTRREALRIGGVVVGTTAALTVAACGSTDSGYSESTPDPLVALSVAARRDVENAIAAIAVAPERAAALSVVADQRSAHADALTAEVRRLDPVDPSVGVTSATDATTAEVPVAGPPPTLDDVRVALQSSARTAADIARTLSGYRAGLVGSISAACSVHASVVLA